MPWKRRKQSFMLKVNEGGIQAVSLKPLSPIDEEFRFNFPPQHPVTTVGLLDASDKVFGKIRTLSEEESGPRPIQTVSKKAPGSISNRTVSKEEPEVSAFVTTNGHQATRPKHLKFSSLANGHVGSSVLTTGGASVSSGNGSSMGVKVFDNNLATVDFRESWSRGLEFSLSTLTMTIGLINLLRFPVLLHRNGG
ncbi:uncharacterized protein LOC111089414, partial [Limulus polyphemus]|uniref:Uncharacterized protein LOC111089414 n=1 Tax=Limulus polyphemus TaxID=6850 RepID=A0ABM1TNW2_LIMPO